ncbi:MAG: hypothetical protein MUF31_09805 [Akkermansiaceae bacterium]|jgi:hypothetical protein|nr:hypothetical protein [Akkermansiaceae bacterium]
MRKSPAAAAILFPLGALLFLFTKPGKPTPSPAPTASAPPPVTAPAELPGDHLLADWGSEETRPIEDLRKLRALTLGYFSVIKDLSRHPIGGNADLTACLLGKNPEKRAFLRPDHPALRDGTEIIDRWGTPIFVHPEAARELTLRSAGEDRAMFTADDLVLAPNGSILPASSP